MAVIELKNVSKEYNHHAVVDNVSMQIEEGEIYGLIGRNGAGKTTIIRMILGLATPTSGEIIINGKSGAELENERKRIGAIIENPAFLPNLNAMENMIVAGKIIGETDKERFAEELRFVGLDPSSELPARNFSLGMKQRLAIATSLLGDPSILVLDEPVNGLDPTGIFEIRELIIKMNRERKVTVLISSHLLAELGKMANAYGVVEKGKLVNELRGSELENIIRPYVKVVVGDLKNALNLIASTFKAHEFDILPYNTIAIYDVERGVSGIAELFAKADIPIVSISQQEGDTESAFISMMGGIGNEN